MNTATLTKIEYRCKYCDKAFARESTLAVHMCEPKRRYSEQNEKGVQLGLQAYLRFYEVTQGSAKLKTFDDFAKSPYYRAFVKFGRHCVAINAINTAEFIKWVINQNKKLDYWCQEKIYAEYLAYYLRHEALSDALSRAIEYGIQWSETHGHPANDFLRYGNDNAIAFAISTGRISPWVVYNCVSGQHFLERMNADHRAIVWPVIDPDFWTRKFHDYIADQEYAKEILKQAGW